MRRNVVLAGALVLAAFAAVPAEGDGGGCEAGAPMVPFGEVPPTKRFEVFGGGSVDVTALPGRVHVVVEAEDAAGACVVLCEGVAALAADFGCPDGGAGQLWVTLRYAGGSPTGVAQWWLH